MERTKSPRPPAGLRRMLFRLPIHLYRLRLGWLLGRRLVLINHIGRRTGRPRHVVVEVVAHDRAAGTVTVAAGFGPHTDWYRNLRAHPDVTIQLAGRRLAVRAESLAADEGGEVMVGYARRHPWLARGLGRFMGFEVDGSEADYRAAGREIPFLRFHPRPPAPPG